MSGWDFVLTLLDYLSPSRCQAVQAARDDFSVFPVFSRDWERYQQSLNEKESLWEEELRRLMDKSAGAANTSTAQK
jgi:hypothetical protein